MELYLPDKTNKFFRLLMGVDLDFLKSPHVKPNELVLKGFKHRW